MRSHSIRVPCRCSLHRTQLPLSQVLQCSTVSINIGIFEPCLAHNTAIIPEKSYAIPVVVIQAVHNGIHNVFKIETYLLSLQKGIRFS